jgi:hypothetical protein
MGRLGGMCVHRGIAIDGGNNQGRADDGPCTVGYRMPSAAPALP